MAQPTAGRRKRRRFRFVRQRQGRDRPDRPRRSSCLIAIIGPWIAPYDPDARSDDLLQPPSGEHWFGTTHLGQDVFSQILVGTRGVMVVGFVAGIVATVLSRARRRHRRLPRRRRRRGAVGAVQRLPGDPGAAADHHHRRGQLPTAGDAAGRPRHRPHRRGPGARGCCAPRRCRCAAATTSRRPGPPASRTWRIITVEILPNLTAIIAVRLRRHGHLRGPLRDHAGLHRHRRRSPTGTGARSCSGRRASRRCAQGAWWWFVPAGLCIALLGTALSLINFGIDEFVNPRLRSAGKTKVKTAPARTVRMRVGFTPVLYERASDAARDARQPHRAPQRGRRA